jgi:hypothetical protein
MTGLLVVETERARWDVAQRQNRVLAQDGEEEAAR